MQHLLELKSKYPKGKLVSGNTEVGVEANTRNIHPPVLICCNGIDELNSIEVHEKGLLDVVSTSRFGN